MIIVQTLNYIKIKIDIETLGQSVNELNSNISTLDDKYFPLLKRNMAGDISALDNVDESKLISLMNISSEELKQIRDNFFAEYDDSDMVLSDFQSLEKYIMQSDEKNTNSIFENLYEKSNNILYSKWYAYILSGVIKYHLGGEITEISLYMDDELSIGGTIKIDNLYSINVSNNIKGGLSVRTIYTREGIIQLWVFDEGKKSAMEREKYHNLSESIEKDGIN